MIHTEDLELMRLACGDDAAATRLVERLQPLLARIVRARVGHAAEADELVVESLTRVVMRAGQYRGEMPIEHWAARITVRLVCDHRRCLARRPQSSLDAVQALTDQRQDAILVSDSREAVERLLDTLDAADRLVVVLLDLEGRSTAEIAALTGWSRTAIKVRAFRARRRLRRIASTILGGQP